MSGFDPDPEIRNKQRELLRDALEARGYDEDLFWAQLESVSTRYAALRYTDEDANEEEQCRAAFTALESARTLFGRDNFDRFLYEAVAPGMSFSIATNAPHPSQRLCWIANGCRGADAWDGSKTYILSFEVKFFPKSTASPPPNEKTFPHDDKEISSRATLNTRCVTSERCEGI